MGSDILKGLDVLVIEDEALLRKQVGAHMESLGADVTGVSTLAEAREMLGTMSFDVALLDIHLPDGKGTELLQQQRFASNTSVIVMTADGGVAGAVEAIRLGASDYLVKPFEVDELPLVIGRARKTRQSARIEEFRRFTGDNAGLVFGPSLQVVRSQLDKIIVADQRVQGPLSPVLIEGETGTGKTSIARWLHQQGPRAGQPLVEVNCPALPETLAESELFGHERGAFTDARAARMGLFEAANGGTLFLDELPSLSPALQAKVLKTIEDQRIRRLGGTHERPVDVRVIAATNQNLRELVDAGNFREDLYHRLDLFRISIPPLRARGEDILRLAESLLERLCQRHRLPLKAISSQGRDQLASYPWPGNVRELAHELERALVFEEGEELGLDLLNSQGSKTSGLGPDEWFNPEFRFPDQGFDLEAAIHRLINHALSQSRNNVSAAARLLGVSRDYVRYRLTADSEGAPGE